VCQNVNLLSPELLAGAQGSERASQLQLSPLAPVIKVRHRDALPPNALVNPPARLGAPVNALTARPLGVVGDHVRVEEDVRGRVVRDVGEGGAVAVAVV